MNTLQTDLYFANTRKAVRESLPDIKRQLDSLSASRAGYGYLVLADIYGEDFLVNPNHVVRYEPRTD